MPDRKPREKVVAEITLAYLTQVAAEVGRRLSQEEAVAFLNQEGRAYDMSKRMMQAGEDYIKSRLRAGRPIPLPGPAANHGRMAI
jgi:hypothetical protein